MRNQEDERRQLEEAQNRAEELRRQAEEAANLEKEERERKVKKRKSFKLLIIFLDNTSRFTVVIQSLCVCVCVCVHGSLLT